MKLFLNKKWLVRLSNVSERCSQEFTPYKLSTLYNFLQTSHTNVERAFMQEVYNLIRIDHGLTLYASNPLVINKSFFCNLLQFSKDEVQLLHYGNIVNRLT